VRRGAARHAGGGRFGKRLIQSLVSRRARRRPEIPASASVRGDAAPSATDSA